ncbi:hypothetical protein [Sphingomonas aquatilis]
MLKRCWTIDISRPCDIERQVVAVVEEMDELGIFDLLRSTIGANDNQRPASPTEEN